MSLNFEDADMGQAKGKIGLYGGTGSGKTETALAQATKIGRTYMIATERGADFYTKRYKFKNAFTNSCDDALVLIKKALDDKAECVIVDQLTNFWEAAQNSFISKEHMKASKTWKQIEANGQIPWTAWGKIKRPYKKLVHTLMDAPIHVWFLARLAIEYKMGKDDSPEKVGERMATEKDTPYEPHIILKLEFQPKGLKGGKPVWYALCEKTRVETIPQGTLWESTGRDPGFRDILDPMFAELGAVQKPSPEIPFDPDDTTVDETGPTLVQLKLLEVLATKGGIPQDKLQALCAVINTEEAGLVINTLTAGNFSIFDNVEAWVSGIRAAKGGV